MLIILLPAVLAIDCSDGDEACIDHACSAFCNAYTCTHPLCPGCGPEVGCPAHSPSPPPPPRPPPQPPWDENLKPGELNVRARPLQSGLVAASPRFSLASLHASLPVRLCDSLTIHCLAPASQIVAVGSKLYANGVRLHIKGVNWFGSEGRSGPPLGLDKHPCKDREGKLLDEWHPCGIAW